MNSRSMKPTAVVGALVVATLLALPGTGHAYRMSGVGGKLGFTSPENLDGTVTLGGHLEFEQSDSRLHLMPNVMYWNVNGVSNVQPNMDVYYHFNSEGQITPYLGGGLGLNIRNSDSNSSTDVGANLFGGLRFPGTNNHYFLEGRYTASDQNQVALLGGITFHTR